MAKVNRKDSIKKQQYYVEYLGWKEARGIAGREYTEPIVRELINRRKQQENLPRLTIQVSRKELKITQEVDKRKGKIEKIKYPPIPAQDVTYVCQALSPDKDVVACIFLGFNPYTKCAVHTHVYRCDSEDTAAIFVAHVNQLLEIPTHQHRIRKIEADLAAKGQIQSRFIESDDPPTHHSGSSGGSRSPPYSGSGDNIGISRERGSSGKRPPPNDIANDITPYDSLAAELHQKLNAKEEAPLLLPPKDYDTVCRRRGNLLDIDLRRSKQDNIVGDAAPRKDSNDGGVDSGLGSDLHSPTGDSLPNLDSSLDDDVLRPIIPSWKRASQNSEGAPASLQRIFDQRANYNSDYSGPYESRDSYDQGGRPLSPGPYHQSHDYMYGTYVSTRSSGSGGHTPTEPGNYMIGGYHRPLSRSASGNSWGPNDRNSGGESPRYVHAAPQHVRGQSLDEGYNTVSDTAPFYDDHHRVPTKSHGLRNSGSEDLKFARGRSASPEDPLARTMPESNFRGGHYRHEFSPQNHRRSQTVETRNSRGYYN